ncbi:hypothetical protein JHK82_055471 [Glycine max]|uniref:Uncharacterized protein n=1 Tax=Glycine max TaxID=3847 RepID=A0A0R0EG42_SOYBN|nr:hypothetical protein JHK86_055303 [Glycine max]KAG4918026.1 hypothetical protein JHK85_056307 [Glycine max]KAG5074106.1 hypothetical protein JHK84_055337 [Glycine max]KAG5076776.1 hypothetical protein JHK82_055471 [Glycine max]KAH1034753.1 hypothetical protein GYH30_054940 [Glycine max]
MISLRLLSNALKQNLWAIGASSHIISLARTAIANLESAVLPPSSNKVAIPLDATVKIIFPFKRNAKDNVFHIKNFPIRRKKIPPHCRLTAFMIISNINFCSSETK